MIKGIFFDFDGTLIKLTGVHFQSLNLAIKQIAGEKYLISEQEHYNAYNGLSTKTKLNKLVLDKGLDKSLIKDIFFCKQKYTIESINNLIIENTQLISDLTKLRNEGFSLFCISNAIPLTVSVGLQRLGILDLFDFFVGNDYTERQKPAPDIYLKAFIEAQLDPKECLIVEDSKHGRESASRTGAYICTVDDENDTTYEHIKKAINKYNIQKPIKWVDSKLNVLIPMSGAGSRFAQAGFKLPKPLIDVNGKPMIQNVVENINIDANFIFVVQKSHYEQYNLGTLLPLIAPGCEIIQTDGMTDGAACTTLLAKNLIDNDMHLIIANSDQFVEWNSCDFMSNMISYKYDAGILTFKANETKWSYAKNNEDGFVCEVAEKRVISDNATIGIYYWNKGSDYVKYAEQMISKNIRTNNEFYVCPVFNEAILDGKKIKTYEAKKMYGLGTPEDLELFLLNCSSFNE